MCKTMKQFIPQHLWGSLSHILLLLSSATPLNYMMELWKTHNSKGADILLFAQMHLLWQHVNGEVGLDHPRARQIAHLVQKVPFDVTRSSVGSVQPSQVAQLTSLGLSYLIHAVHAACSR